MRLKNISKISIASIILLVFLFSGFGCKGMSKKEVAATQAVNLEFWTVYDDVEQINEAITKYTEQRPYLNITVRQLRSDEVYERLVEELAEDRSPDIVSIHVRELPKYISKLSPMPDSYVDTLVTQQKNLVNQIETIVNTGVVSLPNAFQIDQEFLQTVKNDIIVNNRIYGLPISLDTMAIYYNKDLLDRSGVPEVPKTWEDFQEAIRRITKINTITGDVVQSGVALGGAYNITGIDDIYYILFKQSGIDLVSNNRATFNLTERGSRESLAMSVVSFYTDFANPTRDTFSWDESMPESLESFIQGKTAFYFGYSFNNIQIKSRAPQLNYGIIPMLQLDLDNPANVANYWIQTVVGKSKHKNEAWGFINFLTRSSFTEEYLENSIRPTALRRFVSKQKENVDLEPFVSQLLISKNWYRGNNYAGAVQALQEMSAKWIDIPFEYETKVESWYQENLNSAAAKINQTL